MGRPEEKLLCSHWEALSLTSWPRRCTYSLPSQTTGCAADASVGAHQPMCHGRASSSGKTASRSAYRCLEKCRSSNFIHLHGDFVKKADDKCFCASKKYPQAFMLALWVPLSVGSTAAL